MSGKLANDDRLAPSVPFLLVAIAAATDCDTPVNPVLSGKYVDKTIIEVLRGSQNCLTTSRLLYIAAPNPRSCLVSCPWRLLDSLRYSSTYRKMSVVKFDLVRSHILLLERRKRILCSGLFQAESTGPVVPEKVASIRIVRGYEARASVEVANPGQIPKHDSYRDAWRRSKLAFKVGTHVFRRSGVRFREVCLPYNSINIWREVYSVHVDHPPVPSHPRTNARTDRRSNATGQYIRVVQSHVSLTIGKKAEVTPTRSSYGETRTVLFSTSWV